MDFNAIHFDILMTLKSEQPVNSTETSASTCNGPMVQQSKGLGPAKLTGGESGSAMNQDSCCRKEMAVRVSTDAGMRGSQGTM
jgi:hypothetical protein